ncbi:universal stress protein [Ramlibacter humi]|uniref:Universal stress protein n=1 Tax=Ramlibacter humi TaxID=2530451 RepID=A0A4Z0CBD8_9BURK|nr:universal stress protein [Ramlibacter humi]TFZ08651.1 universal stress protein [Ramlibacter humi]
MAGFQCILVPVDGSESSKHALMAAIGLAKESGGQVRMAHVLDELEYASAWEFSAQVVEESRRQARAFLDRWATECAAQGVQCDARLLEEPGSRLGEVVAREAAAWPADLVVVGSHGRRGLGRVLLGSGAEQIVRFASAPVLVLRGQQRKD